MTIPPVTFPSWPCLFTGLTPEQLGRYWFLNPDGSVLTSHIWRDKSLFSLFNKRIFVLNVPATYPAWRINGEMITGFMSPSISCFPPELKFFIGKNWIINGTHIAESFQAFEMKKNLFLRKMNEDFELMVYVIKIPDNVTHLSRLGKTKTLKLIHLSYLKIDKFLNQILNNNSVENILIFSDHGIIHFKHEFFFKRWLEKKKLIFINQRRGFFLINIMLKIYAIFRIFVRSTKFVNYFKKLINYQKKRINRRSPSNSKEKSLIQNKIIFGPFTSNVGAIYLYGNLKKKKKEIKEILEYDKNIDRLVIHNKENFPDIFVILKDKYLFSALPSMYLKRRRDTYGHHEIGFFMAYGKDIKRGHTNIINYQDIAPTISKLCEIKKPDYMKGEALKIFRNNN